MGTIKSKKFEPRAESRRTRHGNRRLPRRNVRRLPRFHRLAVPHRRPIRRPPRRRRHTIHRPHRPQKSPITECHPRFRSLQRTILHARRSRRESARHNKIPHRRWPPRPQRPRRHARSSGPNYTAKAESSIAPWATTPKSSRSPKSPNSCAADFSGRSENSRDPLRLFKPPSRQERQDQNAKKEELNSLPVSTSRRRIFLPQESCFQPPK